VINGKLLPCPAAIPLPRRPTRIRSHDAPQRTRIPSGNGQGDLGPAAEDRDSAARRARRLLPNRPPQEVAARTPGRRSRLRLTRKAYGHNSKPVPLRSYRTNSRYA